MPAAGGAVGAAPTPYPPAPTSAPDQDEAAKTRSRSSSRGPAGDSAAAGPILLQGPVKKRGGSWRALKKRHFVLLPAAIHYSAAPDGKVLGEVPLGPATEVTALGPKAFNVYTAPNARVFECEADSGPDRDMWVAAITAAVAALRT
jgi:hypothetical protein